MGVYLDGVQRRSGSLAPIAQTAAMALPRRRILESPSFTRGSSMDGLMRRVAATTAPPLAAASNTAPGTLPTAAEPLSAGASWYLPAGLAVATVGVAIGAITLDASKLPTLNLSSLMPRAAVTPSNAASPKPSPVAAAAATPTAIQQAMQGVVGQQASAAGVPTGIMAIDLKTGATASSNADAIFTSASLYKLFVANAIYQGIDAGTIRYTDLTPGTRMNVQSCLRFMITESSNTCGEALARVVGWDSQNAGLHTAGFTHTLLRQNANEQTSASDVALLLQKLYNGNLLSAPSTTAFINLLQNQQINDRLPVGLPAGVSVAHKTGDLNGLAHDAGIIYAPSGNYIAVALSGPWPSTSQAYGWFAQFSDSLYGSLAAARVAK